jgi:hypothetical protein
MSQKQKTSSWMYQDSLKLTVEQWKSLLFDKKIFNEDAVKLISFVYSQPQHQSSATEIGIIFNGGSQQKITALNRSIAKKIYTKLDQVPPFNSVGGKRYWNVIFDGNPQCEINHSGYFTWKLRPNLVIAIHEIDLVTLYLIWRALPSIVCGAVLSNRKFCTVRGDTENRITSNGAE